MQTFLISSNFEETAKVLDNQRLNKQALEGWQILMNLLALDPAGNHREPKGWSNHPAVKMWRGYEASLLLYILEMVKEWKARGFKSTIGDKALATMSTAIGFNLTSGDQLASLGIAHQPPWMDDEGIMSTHRLALLTKNYNWYNQFNWDEDPGHPPTSYEYIWPVK